MSTPTTTVQSLLCHPKDPLTPLEGVNVVYKIGCKNCDKFYIGETRNLTLRLNEHKLAIRRGDTHINAIVAHCWETDHMMNWEECKTLINNRKQILYTRRLKEAIWIRRHGTLNQDDGNTMIRDHWSTLLLRNRKLTF